MPEQETLERARKDKAEGKAPSTQAGEFVREEMRHIREGKHGARSTKQAIAIGLSKARRAGVKAAFSAAGLVRRKRQGLLVATPPRQHLLTVTNRDTPLLAGRTHRLHGRELNR